MNTFTFKECTLTLEERKALTAEVRELMSGCPADVPVRQYLQTVLQQRVQSMSSLEAEQIVTDIESGINEFKTYKAKVKRGSPIDIESLLAGKSSQEAFSLLVDMLAVIRLRGEITSPVTKEAIDQIRESIITGRKPTEETVKILSREFEDEFNELLQKLNLEPESIKSIDASEIKPEVIDEFRINPDVEIFFAVLIYIHKVSGDESYAQIVEDNHLLGVTVAASVSLARNNADFASGAIKRPFWDNETKRDFLIYFLFLALVFPVWASILGWESVLVAIGVTSNLVIMSASLCLGIITAIGAIYALEWIIDKCKHGDGGGTRQAVPPVALESYDQKQNLLTERVKSQE